MKKSRLAKVVGAGLVSVLCLPTVAQAQNWKAAGEGVVKVYKELGGTVKYAQKVGTATPTVKNAATLSGKIEKAVEETRKAAQVSNEMAKTGVTAGAKESAVNLSKQFGEQMKNAADQVSLSRAAGKPLASNPTKYYSMSNTGEKSSTLTEPISSEPLGALYQSQFDNFFNQLFDEMVFASGEKHIDWSKFPATREEQVKFLRNYADGLNDEMQAAFYVHTSLDKPFLAKIAWVSDKYNLNAQNFIITADYEANAYREKIYDAYNISAGLTDAIEMAVAKYHINIKQTDELTRAVRDLKLGEKEQVLAKAEEMFGKTKYYGMANKAEKIPALTVKVPKISKDKIYGLPPAVQQGYFNGIIENMISEAARKEHGVEIDWDKVLFYGANQDKLIREYVDGLNDEMQEMFYHRVSLDKATQAKIAWAASTYNLSNCANLLAAADLTLQKFREVVLERPYYFLTDDAKKALSMVAAKYRLAIIELDDFAGTVYFSELKDPEAILQLAEKKFGAKLDKTVKSNSVQYGGDDAGADTDMSPFFDEGGDVLDDFF